MIQNVVAPSLLESNRDLSPVKPPRGYVLQKGVTINIVAPTVRLVPSPDTEGSTPPRRASVSSFPCASPVPTPRGLIPAPDAEGTSGTLPRRASVSSFPCASPVPTPRCLIPAPDSAPPRRASISCLPSAPSSLTLSPPRPSPRTCGPIHISPSPRLVQSFISKSADQLPGLTPPAASASNFTSLTSCFGFGSPSSGHKAPPVGSFEVRDLPLGFWPFDPNLPALRSQLLAALGASSSSRFEAMTGFHGGLNDGIWFLRGPDETLVLKLVKFDRFAPPQMVEERIFSKLYQEVPHIAEDPHVAFPKKVFRLLGPNNVRKHDLFVMRRAPGKSLDHIISEKWRSNRKGDIMKIFAKVGECLAGFHRRYGGRQHNDAGTQNILYDEESQHVTFIDLGGMGNKTDKTDVHRLSQLVLKLSRCSSYGPDLAVAVEHFQQGYKRALQTAVTL